jgi:hypothetical protein
MSTEPTVDEVESALQNGEQQDPKSQADAESAAEAKAAAEKYAQKDLASAVGDAVQAKRTAGTSDHQGSWDLDLDDLTSIKVRLGGKVWEAVEPTIEVNKDLTRALPKIEGDDAEAALQALNSIYPQVARVLRSTEDGLPPSQEFVDRHLSGRNFGRLMERLNSDAQEGNR